jgi:hypothetical protein
MKIKYTIGLLWISLISFGQTTENSGLYINSAEKLLKTEGRLTIGGYGEVHYNQPLEGSIRNNGKLDVHRMVLLFRYHFNERTQFVTEFEFEHVSEVYIEQAFLQFKITDYLNFRGGLLLIPMGIINEYHEPTTFNGVERPFIDTKIAPTTWREIGLGFTGNIIPFSIRYQAYLVNGFNGYDGEAHLNGKNGLRSGRQKGMESYVSSPNIAVKVEYYGLKGLNLGVSGYFGNTQSTLFNGIDRDDQHAIARADSSIVGISMLGIDARYNLGALQFRGQYYLSSISNTEKYNQFTLSVDGQNDLGSSMNGYYVEAGYNVFSFFNSIQTELVQFIRYESYDTHKKVEGGITKNPAFNNLVITSGLSWKLAPGAVIKTDFQLVKPENSNTFLKIFNAGIGVMF